jgi:hypothetical protein
MNPYALLVSCLALAVAGCAVPPPGATQAMKEGLVAVHSPTLDELYLRPDADLPGYRKVMIDPVPVDVRNDFLTQTHAYNRIQAPSVYPYRDALGLVKEMAATLESSVAEAFKARGYEIVEGPGPGVLRLSPGIGELYVNAPDRLSPWRTRTFTRDAGQATLYLEAHDAVTGTLLGRVVHHAIARELSRINVADDVSNRFWFDTLFRRWAENCVAEFQAGTRRP